MLCMTENLLNSSVKQARSVSPNTLLFGDATPMESSWMAELDQIQSATAPRTIRDKLMDRKSGLIVAAVKSQQQLNTDNLNKRYFTYPRTPKIRRFSEHAGIKPIQVHSIGTRSTGSSTPAQKRIVDPNEETFIGPLNQGEEERQRFYIPG